MDSQTREELLKLFQSKLNRAMVYYLETCTRCGVCTTACHVYQSMPQAKYIAAYRAEIVRRIYKKYFKAQGTLWPSYGDAKELTEAALQELYDTAYSCTGCRRCMVYCPFGIDTQMIMSIAKLLLVGAHAEPEILTLLADTSIEKGRSLEFFKEGFLQGVKNLEQQVVAKWKMEAEGKTVIPVDVGGPISFMWPWPVPIPSFQRRRFSMPQKKTGPSVSLKRSILAPLWGIPPAPSSFWTALFRKLYA
ncbi:4Fe-4S dicluster domain-containing protein [Desulfosoma sp.]|uniref:4Fe-4S dicluster domain-containing protein n=1 Tax=Desulfosoma sp. TaxID=2603217 RepID=UPI0040499289